MEATNRDGKPLENELSSGKGLTEEEKKPEKTKE